MEEIVESDFEEIKKQVNEKKQGTITGNIKNINYEINLSKPVRVVLKEENNRIEFYSGKLALSDIEIHREEKRVHYRKKNALNVGVTLIRTVSVVQSEINSKEYVSEKYLIREQFDDNMIPKKCEKIIEDLISNNDKIKTTNEGEFSKDEIVSNDELNSLIHSEEELEKYLVDGSKTKLGDFPSGFYEDRHDFEYNKINNKQIEGKSYDDYISIAIEKLDRYKSLINQIDNIINNNSENSENSELKIVSLEEEKQNEIVEQNVNVEEEIDKEIDDGNDVTEEDLNSVLKELMEKRNQEEREQIRNAKVKKVKELINLNKELDDEIDSIQKGKKEEGEN